MTLNQILISKEKILKNNSDIPYRYSQTSVITQEGRAYFPYPDWWRGEYMSDLPIIVEREAGFRPRLEKSGKDGLDELTIEGGGTTDSYGFDKEDVTLSAGDNKRLRKIDLYR